MKYVVMINASHNFKEGYGMTKVPTLNVVTNKWIQNCKKY